MYELKDGSCFAVAGRLDDGHVVKVSRCIGAAGHLI